jgi:hypothetical protein
LLLTSKKVFSGNGFFLCFLKTYEGEKTHNMLSLKLKFRFKNLCSISSLIGCEKDVAIIDKYDKKSLCPYVFEMSSPFASFG